MWDREGGGGGGGAHTTHGRGGKREVEGGHGGRVPDPFRWRRWKSGRDCLLILAVFFWLLLLFMMNSMSGVFAEGFRTLALVERRPGRWHTRWCSRGPL